MQNSIKNIEKKETLSPISGSDQLTKISSSHCSKLINIEDEPNQNNDGIIKVDVHLEDEAVWLIQAHMAELFVKGRSTITEHIRNIFAEGELEEKLVCRNFRHTTQHAAIRKNSDFKC